MPEEVRLMAALVTGPGAPFIPVKAQGHPVCATSRHCQILLHQLGGAMARPPEAGTAFPSRAAEWMLTVIGMWTDPAKPADRHVAWARGLWEAMRPWSAGTYVKHLGDEGEGRVREAYGTSYDRLVALKQTWDPGNVFRLNQNIAPLPKY
jgi:hypothetical protein